MEPLVELTQHKGDSECRVGVGTTDELCDFEKIPEGGPEEDEPLSYVRNVLKAGLELDASLGVNPFALGMIGSSDTHNGTPGATREDDFPGHAGDSDDTPEDRLRPMTVLNNPGGLMVLWAEENSRDALFDAMQRRESFATSGTRPVVRFFGGFDLPEDLCGETELVQQGYANGVSMGGELLAPAQVAAPRFVIDAGQDPGSAGFPGTRLAEIQIIKGLARRPGRDPRAGGLDRRWGSPAGRRRSRELRPRRQRRADAVRGLARRRLRFLGARVLLRPRAGEPDLPLVDPAVSRARRRLQHTGAPRLRGLLRWQRPRDDPGARHELTHLGAPAAGAWRRTWARLRMAGNRRAGAAPASVRFETLDAVRLLPETVARLAYVPSEIGGLHE